MPKDINEKWTGVAGSDPNMLPQAVDDVFSGVSENDPYVITVSSLFANDKAGAAKTLYSTEDDASASTATISADATTITYKANGKYDYLAAGATATDTFNYTIQMANGALSTAKVTLNVVGQNDLASILGDKAGAVAEDGTATATGMLKVTDVDQGEAKFGEVGPLDGTYGKFAFDNATGKWDYALNNATANVQELNGGKTVTDTLTVKSFDGTATEKVTVTITGQNDAPTFGGTSTGTVKEDVTKTISGTLTVSDVDHGESSLQVATDLLGQYGKLSVDTSGKWTYTLDNDDTKIQTLNDGQLLSDTIKVKSFDGTEKEIGITIHGTDDIVKAPWEDGHFKAAFVTGPTDPWGVSSAYNQSMDTAFGNGKWTKINGPSQNIFDDGYDFVWIDGGDGTESWFKSYVDQHRAEMESYVEQGGAVYVNAARWTQGTFNIGFGVSLQNNGDTYSQTGSATGDTSKIINGPNGNSGTNWTGSFFSHDSVSGTGITTLIKNSADNAVLAEKSYGEGNALFGGITSHFFHGPSPQAAVLEANILDYAASYASDYMFA